MALRVVWTKRALRNFAEGANFAEEMWGAEMKSAFISRTFRTIDLINAFPEIGILEDPSKGIRSFRMPPHHRLYYRTDETRLLILSIFDKRMDHDRLWQ